MKSNASKPSVWGLVRRIGLGPGFAIRHAVKGLVAAGSDIHRMRAAESSHQVFEAVSDEARKRRESFVRWWSSIGDAVDATGADAPCANVTMLND